MQQISMVVLALALTLTGSLATQSFAESGDDDCKAVFERSDVDNDQWLRGVEAQGYLQTMERAGIERANSDAKLSESEFINACEKGAFRK